MNVAYLLMSVSKKLKYDLNLALQTIEMTAQQFSVLQHIAQLSKYQAVSAINLAHHLDMDKPTISGILSRLEKKGLVLKESHPEDKRAYVLKLSEDGLLKLKDCTVIADRVLNEFLTPLSISENQFLIDILNKLNNERK